MSGPKVPFVCYMVHACMWHPVCVSTQWPKRRLHILFTFHPATLRQGFSPNWKLAGWLSLRIHLSLCPDTGVRGMHGHVWLAWGPRVLSSGLHTYRVNVCVHWATSPAPQSTFCMLNLVSSSFLHANLYHIKVEIMSPSTPSLIEISLLTVEYIMTNYALHLHCIVSWQHIPQGSVVKHETPRIPPTVVGF